MEPIDWGELRRVALEMTGRAYVPYSNFAVGAAALVSDGRIVRGCNVESASYGLTLCAECGVISDLIAGGGGELLAFCCVDGAGQEIMPCGRCRQLLWEHGGRELQVATPAGIRTMDAVLPQAFDADDLSGMR